MLGYNVNMIKQPKLVLLLPFYLLAFYVTSVFVKIAGLGLGLVAEHDYILRAFIYSLYLFGGSIVLGALASLYFIFLPNDRNPRVRTMLLVGAPGLVMCLSLSLFALYALL